MSIQHRPAAIVLATATGLALAGCVTIQSGPEEDSAPTAEAPPAAQPPPEPEPERRPEPVGQTPEATAAPPAPEAPPEWTDVLAGTRSGVTLISVTTCEAAGSGTGFLVSEDLIATAAHVVEGASSVTVGPAGSVTEAEIIGYNREADLALLRIEEPVDGHVFTFAEESPPLGTEVRALGYPLQTGLSISEGTVSSDEPGQAFLDERYRYLQTTAAINPGNSGGPLIARDGQVQGVVLMIQRYNETMDVPVEGTAFALSAQDALPMLREWIETPQTVPLERCGADPEMVGSIEVLVESDHEYATELAQTLATHGEAINTALYGVAWDFFTAPMKERQGSLENWQSGLHTTYWREVRLESVTGSGAELEVLASIRTEQSAQDGPDGQTCTVWPLTYRMVENPALGLWQIDAATLEEREPVAC